MKWVHTYICGKSQSIYFSDKRSSACFIKRGVAHKTILGHLLYSIYSNDLPSRISHYKIQIYADNVQLYISCSRAYDMSRTSRLNSVLDIIFKWALANGFSLNAIKFSLNAKKSKAIGFIKWRLGVLV